MWVTGVGNKPEARTQGSKSMLSSFINVTLASINTNLRYELVAQQWVLVIIAH